MDTQRTDLQAKKAKAPGSVSTTVENKASQAVSHPFPAENDSKVEHRIEVVEKLITEEISRLQTRVEKLERQVTQNEVELGQLKNEVRSKCLIQFIRGNI